MRRFVIYVHGKGGCAEEAKHYHPLFPDSDVIGFDYHAQTPWEAKEEFPRFFDLHSEGYDSVILIASSIGAFFSMNALGEKNISQAMFVSPIVDMERLITDMMIWSKVTEEELESKKEIPSPVDTLRWDYYQYIISHPITQWSIPTAILYGGKDNLQPEESVRAFAEKFGCSLTVSENSEHPFMAQSDALIVENWLCRNI